MTLTSTPRHGLSYTSFAYSGLKVSAGEVSLTITNNGTLAGAEVAQLYLGARVITRFNL
jgi:beta-glucosidase